MQKETNTAVTSRMTYKIGLIWRHMKTLYTDVAVAGWSTLGLLYFEGTLQLLHAQ